MSVLAAPLAAANDAMPRAGLPYWLSGYRTMLAWHLSSLRMWLGILAVVQVLSGVGFVLGFALFFDEIPMQAALFVSTGVPVINLVMIGLILGPQLVADQKTSQSYDFIRSLPVPHTASAAAWYTVCLIGGLPAVAVSLAVAVLRYDGLPLAIGADVVPAMLLTAFTGTMLGYALAHAISSPMVTRSITQLIVFGIFGATPMLFPIEQLPGWLGSLNWWLPFRHMADAIRASLTDLPYPDLAISYSVLIVWAVVAGTLAVRALGRRQ